MTTTMMMTGREARMTRVRFHDCRNAIPMDTKNVTMNWKTNPIGSDKAICKSSICLC